MKTFEEILKEMQTEAGIDEALSVPQAKRAMDALNRLNSAGKKIRNSQKFSVDAPNQIANAMEVLMRNLQGLKPAHVRELAEIADGIHSSIADMRSYLNRLALVTKMTKGQ